MWGLMATNISSDFFTAPIELSLDQLSFCDTTLKGFDKWLSSLSSIQLGDTSKALFDALEEIFFLKCVETFRFELMYILHPYLEQVLGVLEKNLAHQDLAGHNENVIDLAQQFRCYIARIYSHIAFSTHNELVDNEFSLFSFRHKKNLIKTRLLSSFLALEQFSFLKYQQLVLYRNAFIGQWRTAHHLYNIAYEHKFDLDDISQIIKMAQSLNCICKVYKQINLLDLLNTHQVRPIEIHALYQCSFQWIDLIHLNSQESALSRYFLNIKKDFPPVLNNLHLNKTQQDFFIETQGLLEHINLINLPQHRALSKVERAFLSPSLIFHVQNLLNNTPERRYERYTFSSTIQLTFGLQSAHYYLSHTQKFEDTLALTTKIKFQANSKLLSTWNSEVKTSQHSIVQETKHIYSCKILDISINGYRMRWQGSPPAQLRTGEFLLIQENNKSPWRGGTVRWLKQMPNKHIEFGVEILSQELTPCAIQISTHHKNYHPALLMKNSILNEITLSLIVPGSQMCKEHQNVFLRIQQSQVKVYFTKARMISQSFTQLDFEFLNEEDSTIVNQFIEQHAETIKKQDLWESLK